MSFRPLLTISLFVSVLAATDVCAGERCNGCQASGNSPCIHYRGKKAVRPPYVDPGSAFGYTPTVWMTWPEPQPTVHVPRPTPLVPPAPGGEGLPPPRPAEDRGARPQDDTLVSPVEK